MKLQVLFFMAIILPSVLLSNTRDIPDLQLEPSYFKPSKKPQQVNYEQVQNTKYYESKDGQPVEQYELENKLLEDSDEYGFGYWLRFQEGEEQDMEKYYFLSRLTTNKDYGDLTYYGDRTLSVFLYKSIFVYATYDLDENLKSKERLIKLDENINGNWYFICYSKRENTIVGFLVKFGAQFMIRFEQYGRHKPSRYYKIVFGIQEFEYLQFPGQYANIFYDFDEPAFINTNEDVLKLIQKNCNMPQMLLKYSSFKLITDPSNFNANNKEDSQEMEPFKTQYIITQYSIKGWFRWIDDIKIEELNSFQIFNLRSNQKKQDKTGDRTLEIQQIIGGGAESLLYFSTYSIINEQLSIVQQVKSYQNVWTYASFSYDIAKIKAFGYIIYPGFSQSMSFNDIQHKQVKQLYLTIGADDQISAFNGKIAHVNFNVGPRAFNEQIVIDEDGANFLFLREMQISQNDEIIESKFNSIQPVFQQIYDDDKVNGQSEYSFGMWSRWIRTYPIYLQKRAEIHSIAHLKRQYKQIILEIQLSKESYLFQSLQDIKNIDFQDKLEGCWNYLYFGYDRLQNIALGAVNFNGNQLLTIEFDQKHDLILDVIEFIVGKHNKPAFNGEFAKISFQFGPYSFKQISQLNEISNKGLPFIIPQQQETIQLIGTLQKTPIDEKYEFLQYQGVKEYSISGWIKFSGKQKSGEQYHIITLTQRKLDELSNQVTFEIIKNDISYVFTTYSCIQDCDNQLNVESEFGEYWDQWTFIYFGYKPSQTYSYLQYTFISDNKKMIDIQHYYMAVFSILLGQERKEYSEFTGAMKQWVVNAGDGAYREGDFDNESIKIHFGFIAGTDHIKQAQQTKEHIDILDCETQLIQFQQSENLELDGIHEYGYGLWIQFKHYANKIQLIKPKQMGIARLYLNEIDHLLSIVMNIGQYQFITLENNLNLKYDQYHEGEWIFLYYSYKRLEHTQGQAKAYIYNYNGWNQIIQYIVHPLIRDHLNFQIGQATKNYPQFNGLITGIRIYIGSGSFVDEIQVKQMINKLNPKPKQQFIDNEIEIIQEKTNTYQDQNPLIFEGDSNQYSIQLWFKINPNQFIYRFTQNEIPSDQKFIGDRTLYLKINENNIEYSSYSLLIDDNIDTNVNLQCNINIYHNDLWAFSYQAYSKEEKKMIIFLSIEDQKCEKNIQIVHAISNKFWLYIFQDYNGNTSNMLISDLRLNLGKGSITNNYYKLPSYISGLRQINKIIKEIDIIDEIQVLEFTEIESMTEYGISFWWKYSSTYPLRLYKKNENIQIFRMTSNKEETNGIIELGDRLLSAYIYQNKLSFNSYDLNDNAPNEYKEIQIKRLENRWYFVYAGYKRKLQLAKFELYDGQEYQQTLNENLLQKPLTNYLGVIVGEQNILLSQITIMIGSGSFGQSGSFLESRLSDYIIQYELPEQLSLEYKYNQKHGVIDLEQKLNQNNFLDIGSYAVCGWFKLNYKADIKFNQEQSCVTLIRLYENEKLNDKLLQGDRTLLIQICDQQFIKFQTYTLNEIQTINEHKLIDYQIQLDSSQIWHYVYFGYNDLKEEIFMLVRQFENDEIKIINKIQHMQTNYLGILFGKEIDGNQFDGQLKDWQLLYGYNAYIQKIDQMPNIENIKNNQKYIWKQNEDIHEFDNEVKEYAIGVWTRQLSEFYDCKQIQFHSIFRFVNRKNYEDRNTYGDRVLYTYLTNKNYEFSSYDIKQQQTSINMQIPYEFIEGDWNYIYFAYKDGNLFAAILHNQDKKVEHRQFQNIEHDILGYSQLITRKSEFGFQDFKGDLYDLRVFLGQGSYIDDTEKLKQMINKYHQKLPENNIQIDEFKWEIELFNSDSNKNDVFKYDFDLPMQINYQIYAWVYMNNKQELDSLQGIIKLTTNLNLNTLLLLGKSDQLTFGTYSFTKKVQIIWQSQEINNQEWVYIQLAHSDDMTHFNIHKVDSVIEYKFKSRHVVPQHFQLQLCKFDSFEDFNGQLKGVQVLWNHSLDDEQQILVHQ